MKLTHQLLTGLKSMTLVVLFLFVQPVSAKTEKIWLCKSQGAVRSIRAESSPAGCQAYYSKEGRSHVVGQISQSSACNSIVDQIKETLVSSKWQCRAVAHYGETNLTPPSISAGI